jgi:hypothetical protein
VRGNSRPGPHWPTGGREATPAARPANRRARSDARRAAGQQAGADAWGRQRGRLTRGPGRTRGGLERLTGGAGKGKNTRKRRSKFPNSKTTISRDPKFTKFLLKQDHSTKNIMQPLELKKLSNIAHNNSSNTAVF